MREARQRLPAHLQDRYRPYAFLDAELAPAMAAADLIVARAGASALGELPAVGAPGLVIPGTFAGAHQRLNADFLANRGAAVVLDDDRARDGALVPTILSLLDDPSRLASMAAAAHALARPDAAERLIRLVADVAYRPAGAPA
jgi:UDP-N-acetylglucosamine--N-acetylmuramyl-(pentapeptide) pyrophosphoryl-undecaprenol N-acetylglucosamine transferase